MVIFILNTILYYKKLESIDSYEYVSDIQILFFNISFQFTDIIVYIFAMGFLYSLIKDLNYRIAVVDMFVYFKNKSSSILIVFYGVIFSMYITALLFYGLNSDIIYDFLNLFFLLFIIIFMCFLMLVFKNFLISDIKDETFYQIRVKYLGFNFKCLFKIIGIIIGVGIIISIFIAAISFVIGEKRIIIGVLGGIIGLLVIVATEILILSILIKINGKIRSSPMTIKKFVNIGIINIMFIVFCGIAIFIDYTIGMNILFYNPLIQELLLAMIVSFIALIINFQVLGVFLDVPLLVALKNGFKLSLRFFYPKVIIITMGAVIFIMINILNGTFLGLIYFINFIVSFYFIEFYIKEKEKIKWV